MKGRRVRSKYVPVLKMLTFDFPPVLKHRLGSPFSATASGEYTGSVGV